MPNTLPGNKLRAASSIRMHSSPRAPEDVQQAFVGCGIGFAHVLHAPHVDDVRKLIGDAQNVQHVLRVLDRGVGEDHFGQRDRTEHLGQRRIRPDVVGQANIVHVVQIIFGIDIGPFDDEAAQRRAVLIVIPLAEFVALDLAAGAGSRSDSG